MSDPATAPAEPAAPAAPAASAPAAPAAAPAEPNGQATAAAPAEPPATNANGEWPATWRQLIAGDDPKVVKQLERFASPKALAESFLETRKKISSGELRSPLPKDATPEQLAQWRADNGIPETPDKYDLTMPDGLVIGEADKPMVDTVVAAMHGMNATPEMVKATVKTYFEIRKQEMQRLAEADVDHKTEVDQQMIDEWGGDYKANVNAIKGLLAQAPQEAAAALMSARTQDGRALANYPSVIRWLAGLAREINPVATLVPGAADQGKAVSDEIASIEAKMGDRNSEYWKGPKAANLQARYRELITAREKMAGK